MEKGLNGQETVPSILSCCECHSTNSDALILSTHYKQDHPDKVNIRQPKTNLNTTCIDCNVEFSKASNLKRHIQKKHPEKFNILWPKQVYKVEVSCDICNETFSSGDSLTKHNIEKHSDINTLCSYCGELADMQTNLNYHLKKHCLQNSHKCPLCSYGSTKNELIKHYENVHNIKIETESLEFSSVEDFLQWKEGVEEETVSTFVKTQGSRGTGNSLSSAYVCHRSGAFRSRGKGIRRTKTLGTNKINGYCPSCIKVYEKNGKCKVRFVKTHIGHEHDLRRIPLNSSDRDELASKLASNIPFESILSEVRELVSSTPSRRIRLLTRKDLHNIKHSAEKSSAGRLKRKGTQHMKTQENNKINGYPPSCMKECEEGGNSCGYEHNLNSSERHQFGSKVASEIPVESMQESVSSASLRCIPSLNKDLQNMKQSCKLNSMTIWPCSDTVSDDEARADGVQENQCVIENDIRQRKNKMIGDCVQAIERADTMEGLDALQVFVTSMMTMDTLEQQTPQKIRKVPKESARTYLIPSAVESDEVIVLVIE